MIQGFQTPRNSRERLSTTTMTDQSTCKITWRFSACPYGEFLSPCVYTVFVYHDQNVFHELQPWPYQENEHHTSSVESLEYKSPRNREGISSSEPWCGTCRNGSDARGYFVWSFLDVFEFIFGYRARFGLCGVDMNSEGRTRYVRNSARWYSGFLKGGELRPASSPGKAYVAA